MLRLEGEVFLLGTAIAAPLKFKKIGDDLRLTQQAFRFKENLRRRPDRREPRLL
ncbi:MAG: hypothetical protein WKF52_08270 [Sphingomicrobium sp.]|jgi:hypothetical protein